jgi:hypothetical protein
MADPSALQQEGQQDAPGFRNLKAGRPLARQSLSPEDLQNVRARAAQWGQIVARRAFGDAGPGLDLDFTALEQLAAAAAAGLTEGTLAAALEQ